MSAPGLALLGNRIAIALLVELQLTQPVRVTTARDSIVWNGGTFIGGRQTGVDPIKEQGGEVIGMAFTLSGVPTEYLSLALQEQIQGKLVTMWFCLMNPDTQAIVDVMELWRGTLDQMPINQGPATATIKVTAEHRGITFSRPRGLKYTDADQQRLFSGDRALEFIVSQATHQDVWPSAAFFKR
jgi:hypothetical protein